MAGTPDRSSGPEGLVNAIRGPDEEVDERDSSLTREFDFRLKPMAHGVQSEHMTKNPQTNGNPMA